MEFNYIQFSFHKSKDFLPPVWFEFFLLSYHGWNQIFLGALCVSWHMIGSEIRSSQLCSVLLEFVCLPTVWSIKRNSLILSSTFYASMRNDQNAHILNRRLHASFCSRQISKRDIPTLFPRSSHSQPLSSTKNQASTMEHLLQAHFININLPPNTITRYLKELCDSIEISLAIPTYLKEYQNTGTLSKCMGRRGCSKW